MLIHFSPLITPQHTKGQAGVSAENLISLIPVAEVRSHSCGTEKCFATFSVFFYPRAERWASKNLWLFCSITGNEASRKSGARHCFYWHQFHGQKIRGKYREIMEDGYKSGYNSCTKLWCCDSEGRAGSSEAACQRLFFEALPLEISTSCNGRCSMCCATRSLNSTQAAVQIQWKREELKQTQQTWFSF